MIERQYSAQRPALKVSAVIKPSGIVTVLLEFKIQQQYLQIFNSKLFKCTSYRLGCSHFFQNLKPYDMLLIFSFLLKQYMTSSLS